MMFLAYTLNILGLIALILASLLKGDQIKKTLFFVLCGNFLVATGYLCGGNGINGAVCAYIAFAQSAINYFFEVKKKPIPKWLMAVYALAFTAINLWTGGFNLPSVLAIVASLCFIMGILQKNGAGYRIWTVLNCVIWSVYDLILATYNGLIVHLAVLIFTVTGMMINDRKMKS